MNLATGKKERTMWPYEKLRKLPRRLGDGIRPVQFEPGLHATLRNQLQLFLGPERACALRAKVGGRTIGNDHDYGERSHSGYVYGARYRHGKLTPPSLGPLELQSGPQNYSSRNGGQESLLLLTETGSNQHQKRRLAWTSEDLAGSFFRS